MEGDTYICYARLIEKTMYVGCTMRDLCGCCVNRTTGENHSKGPYCALERYLSYVVGKLFTEIIYYTHFAYLFYSSFEDEKITSNYFNLSLKGHGFCRVFSFILYNKTKHCI